MDTAGASGEVPAGPRASDEDRERFAARLHEHFEEGRLSLEDLESRLAKVWSARTLVELYALTADLPHPGPRPIAEQRPPRRRRRWWWPFG